MSGLDHDRRVRAQPFEGTERRTGNGNGIFDILPAWARIVFILGPTTAIALYLVWMGALYIPRIMAAVEANRVLMVNLQQTGDDVDAKLDRLQRTIFKVCIQTARTDDERSRCPD